MSDRDIVQFTSGKAYEIPLRADDGSAVVGVTPTLLIAKAAGSFAAISGSVTASDARGIAWWTPDAVDSNTLGRYVLDVSGAGAVSYTIAGEVTTGVVAADVVALDGFAVSTSISGVLDVNVAAWNGFAVSTSISGVPDVNIKYVEGSSVDHVNGTLIVQLSASQPDYTPAVAGETAGVLSARGMTTQWASDVDSQSLSSATNAGTAATQATSAASGVTTLLGRIPAALFAGITSMANWLRAGFRSGNNNATAVSEINATTGSGTGTFDPTTDSAQAIRDRGDAAWTTGSGGGGGAAGDGDVLVNHDTGGTDVLRVVDGHGAGIDGAIIRAYVKSEYDANATSAPERARAITDSAGRWANPMYLNSGVTYTLTFTAAIFTIPSTNVTPEAS